MSFDMNPADEDEHGECRNEIHKLQERIAELEKFQRKCSICEKNPATIIERLPLGTWYVCGDCKCDHKWIWHTNPGTPDGPAEHVKFCEKCGMEYPGSFVE